MAIANSDGSIILSTKVDTSGLNKGMSQMKGKASGLTKTFGKLASAIASAFAIQKIIQFSNESASLATQTEASVQRLVDIYGSASDAVGDFIDQNARALGMSKSAAASFSSVYGNVFSAFADQETNAALTNEYLQMTAVVASKTGRTVEDVQERIRSGLLGNTEAIEDLGVFVNVKTIEMTDAFQRMADGRSWEQLDAYTQQQIRAMAILEQSTAKYGDEVAETSVTIRNQFNAAYQDFRNSWGNIVNTVLLPVLQTLTQIFDIATAGLNVLSGRSENILEDTEVMTDNSADIAENIEEQTDNQKALNKEMKKTLAGFDDIQILSAQTAHGTSGILDSGLQGIGGAQGGKIDGSAYADEINETLAAIMQTVAISMIAIGLILLFTGHAGWGIGTIIFGLELEGISVAAITETDPTKTIETSLLSLQGVAVGASIALGCLLFFVGSKGLGVGLIAYGALQLGITIYEITQFSTSPVENIINTIQGIAAGAMLAIGIFLLYFETNMPLAISLIAGGALLLVDNVADVVEGGVTPEISAWLNGIMLLAEGAALVIGVILLMSEVNIPLGISLVATGAFALGKEVAVNWDAIVEALRGPIGAITVLAGAALLALGIILTCTGNLALGIPLIALGAAALVTPIALNWNAIIEALKGPIGTITAIVSGALLVLGIILVCTDVGIPLGIGLILAGAAGLATVAAVNWDSIVAWVKGAWDAVKGFWNTYIAPVFAAKWWLDLGKTCINGLISGFESGINGIIWAFESMINWIVDGLNSISFDIPDWLGGGSFGINLPRANFGRVKIPRLAQGAVIPPNREFLAVLGDNKKENEIVSPVSTMKQAFMEAMIEMGGNFGSGGNTEVVLEIDGREFGRAVVEQGNRENRRIGTRLVVN